jgi:hypothetical protein
MPGKSIAIDGSTLGFKGKIKTNEVGISLFVLAKRNTGYVHGIILNYRKLTGGVCNLPYSVHFKNSSFLDGLTRAQCVWY